MRQGQWARPQRELSSNLKLKVAHPCALPGCGLEAYRDGSGLTYDYCGRSHAIEHKQQNAYAAGPSSSSVHRGVKRVGMSEEHTVDLSFIGDEDDQLAVAIALSLKKHHRDSVPEDPDLARAVALSLEQSDRNTCQSCTYLNSDSAMECEMCSSVLRSLVQPRSSRSKPTIDRDMQLMEDYWNAKETEDLIKSSVWTCSTCNTTSDMSVDICGQCLDPKMLPAECVRAHVLL
jgi:rubrerythrin